MRENQYQISQDDEDNQDYVSLFFKVISIILCVAIVLVCCGYGAWLWFTKDITGDDYIQNESVNIDSNTINEENTFVGTPLPTATDGVIHKSDLETLQENIIAWQKTGTPARSDNVTNILLIGIDINNKDMSQNSRADAIMIVSINHNTKTITLASVMRDQYCYLEHGGVKKFEKFHHANAYGGPSAQIRTIENYYKISIDNYALVNFYSLPKIIDRLGGVTVNITKAEADYMNNFCGTNVKAGNNNLRGDIALVYMRIRHQTGGDEARVNRQQEVIKQIFAKMRTSSKSNMISLMTDIAKYMRTGYSQDDLLVMATDALLDGWFEYNIRQVSLPDNDCATGFTVKEGKNNVWYWKVDYPVAAQKMQIYLYGKTNINLDENRKSWID